MRCESGVADRFNRGPHSRNQTDSFQMEMPARNSCVVRDLGKDVWKKIRSSYLGSIVKLRADRGKARWKGHERTYVLVGVLNAHPKRQMIVQVISDAELSSAGGGQAHSDVLIFVVGNRQIGGTWTDPAAVGGQPTPGLSAQNFPLAAFQVKKAKAHAKGVAVHGLINVSRIIAAKVRFAVAGHIIVTKFVRDLYAEAGKLRGQTIFGKLALRRIAEGNGSEVRCDVVLGVGRAENIFNVHEPAQSDIRRANFERQRRFTFLSFCLR